MIKKLRNGKYDVISHITGRSFGIYTTKKQAEKRLKQIKYFGSI